MTIDVPAISHCGELKRQPSHVPAARGGYRKPVVPPVMASVPTCNVTIVKAAYDSLIGAAVPAELNVMLMLGSTES